MKKMTVALAAVLSLTAASHAALITTATSYGGWTDSDFQTFTDTGWGSGWNGTTTPGTTPVYQSFTAEDTGTIGSLHLMSARTYEGTHTVEVFELFDGDGSTPNAMPAAWNPSDPNYMVSLGSYSFELFAIGSGSYISDFNLSLEMEAAEQFSITTGHTYAVAVSSAVDAGEFRWSTSTVAASLYAGGGFGGAAPVATKDAGLGYTVIPEPGTLGLIGCAGLGLVVVRRRFMI